MNIDPFKTYMTHTQIPVRLFMASDSTESAWIYGTYFCSDRGQWLQAKWSRDGNCSYMSDNLAGICPEDLCINLESRVWAPIFTNGAKVRVGLAYISKEAAQKVKPDSGFKLLQVVSWTVEESLQ